MLFKTTLIIMYKLYEHLLDGGGSITLGLGQDIKRPLLLIDESESRPDGYRDITSITNLDTWGHKAYATDYLRVRSAIVNLVKQLAKDNALTSVYDAKDAQTKFKPDDVVVHFDTEGSTAEDGIWAHLPGYFVRYDGSTFTKESMIDAGFEYCNEHEKAICLKYSIASVTKMLAYGFKLDRIIEEGKQYHLAAIATRQDRLITASLFVWNIVPGNAQEVIGTCVNPMYGNMYFLYKEFGIKGSLDDYDSQRNKEPGPGILNYIEGTGIWQDNGIAQKDWSTTNDQSIADFAKDLAEILR